jgi:hypothetical protein
MDGTVSEGTIWRFDRTSFKQQWSQRCLQELQIIWLPKELITAGL